MLKSIFQAAQENDLVTLTTILDNHPTMATCVDEATGWTPLHLAAKHNAVKAAEILLEQGADSNAHDEQGISPLQLSGGGTGPPAAAPPRCALLGQQAKRRSN